MKRIALAMCLGILSLYGNSPHNLKFKPTFSRSIETMSTIQDRTEKDKETIFTTSRTGAQVEYEYLKLDALYFDAKLSLLYSDDQGKAPTPLQAQLAELIDLHSYKNDEYLGEVALGYTMNFGKMLFSPYMMQGGQKSIIKIQGHPIEDREKEEKRVINTSTNHVDWFTGLGLRFSRAFSRSFSLGMDAKAFLLPEDYKNRHGKGFKVTMPISYGEEQWGFALSPFYRMTRFTKKVSNEISRRHSVRDWGSSLEMRIGF